jgi:hypothetical protein
VGSGVGAPVAIVSCSAVAAEETERLSSAERVARQPVTAVRTTSLPARYR